MESPDLRLAGFEVTDSPTCMRTPCLNLGEFEEDASPLQSTFCQKMSEEEFESSAASSTEAALMDLIKHMESDPTQLMKILRRRKQEEMEHSGLVSMLKYKFLSHLQGDKFKQKLVTHTECNEKLTELSQGMMMVYNYSLETKGRRFSKRLAAKRAALVESETTPVRKSARNDENRPIHKMSLPPPPAPPLPCSLTGAGSVSVRVAPPPPPIPPPILTPLKARSGNILNSPAVSELKRPPLRNGSTGSLVSVHEELLSSNPLQKLRPTAHHRSPGGTPSKRRGPSAMNSSTDTIDFSTPRGLKTQEPLAQAFLRILEQKFRNIRSPSPASPMNTTPFSPGEYSP